MNRKPAGEIGSIPPPAPVENSGSFPSPMASGDVSTGGGPLPSDLAAVVAAWTTRPDVIRAGIGAMVKASGAK